MQDPKIVDGYIYEQPKTKNKYIVQWIGHKLYGLLSIPSRTGEPGRTSMVFMRAIDGRWEFTEEELKEKLQGWTRLDFKVVVKPI